MKNSSLRPLLALFAAAAGLLLLGTTCKLANKAPAVPTLSGPTTGVAGVAITFTATSTDPESDSIAFQFDWGDGATPAWTAFVASGATTTTSHAYADTGIVTIKVKAKDSNGKESGWTAGHTLNLTDILGSYPDSIAATVDLHHQTLELTLTQDGSHALVSHWPDRDSALMSIVSLATPPTVATFELPGEPVIITPTPDGNHTLVYCMNPSALVCINAAWDSVEHVVPVAGYVGDAVVDRDGRYAYVSTWGTGFSYMLVLSLPDCAVVDTIGTPGIVPWMAYSPRADTLYAVLAADGIAVIDAQNRTFVRKIGTSRWYADLVVTPDGQNIVAVSPEDSGYVVLKATDGSLVSRVPAGETTVHGPAVTSDGKCVILAGGWGIRYYSITTGSLVDSVVVPAASYFALSHDGTRLCAAVESHLYVIERR